MSDGVHPNNRGYAIVADRVEPVLRELLSDE
jgi:lysophospholipase L1-like esterase